MWDTYKGFILAVGVLIVIGGAVYLSHYLDTQRQEGGQELTQDRKEANSGQLDSLLKEQQRRIAANIKIWPVIHNEHLGKVSEDGGSAIVELNLNTKWREGRLLYIFNVSPLSGLLKYIIDSKHRATTAFTIRFQDRDGFVILKENIPLAQMTTIVDDNEGKGIALQSKSSIEVSKELYSSFSIWDVSWSGFQIAKEWYDYDKTPKNRQ